METKEPGKASRVKKGLWKPEEDLILKKYVETHGEGHWTTVSAKSGLMRGGKSCRLRWKNYLRPNIKRGGMSEDEKDLIIRLHKLLGNRWSLIAGRLPGRTDNEVKNYWNTHLNKRFPKAKSTSVDTRSQDKDKPPHAQSQQPRPEPMICHKNEEVKAEEQKGNIVSNPRTANTNHNYTLQSPLLPPFFYCDEPFVPYLDSLVFSEAFGAAEDRWFLM